MAEDWRLCCENASPSEDRAAAVIGVLSDVQFFEQVFVDYGAVAWPREIDLAPDAMYAQIASQRLGKQPAGGSFRRAKT